MMSTVEITQIDLLECEIGAVLFNVIFYTNHLYLNLWLPAVSGSSAVRSYSVLGEASLSSGSFGLRTQQNFYDLKV